MIKMKDIILEKDNGDTPHIAGILLIQKNDLLVLYKEDGDNHGFSADIPKGHISEGGQIFAINTWIPVEPG